MVNVLIVEDDYTIADVLQAALEEEGYFVTGIAGSVAEAVKKAEEVCLDFAVLDINLGAGGSGTDVGMYLHRKQHVGILFATANDDDPDLTPQAGHAVITKPYRLSDLVRALHIIDDLLRFGRTGLVFPYQFRLLDPSMWDLHQKRIELRH